ncbi:MAG: thiamine diphosphokinase [Candidatus Muiribacteriota bacterium]|jgi:thiamine pyrophosphokinase
MSIKKDNALIVLNGDFPKKFSPDFSNYSTHFAADGGAEFFYINKINPDLIIGDLDSVSAETLKFFKKQNCIIKKFPAKKNFSDSELLFKYIRKHYPKIKFVDILGAFSKDRIDHFLVNLNVFTKYAKHFNFCIFDDNFTGYIFNDEISLELEKNIDLSLVSLSNKTVFKKSSGLHYSVDNLKLTKKSSRGLSNKTKTSRIHIEIQEGFVLLLIPKS